jgi:V/A-type H+-transporting ATPase subunit C
MVLKFPYIESEDERYVYAVARIRALETKLLSPQKVSRLAGFSSEELLKSLGDTDYAPFLPSSPNDYEVIIDNGREILYSLMDKLILDPPVIQFLKARFDNYNIKMSLKAKIAETEPKALSPYGNISTSEIMDIFRNELYSRLPSQYEDGVKKAVEAYYIDRDPSMLDIIIDQSYFAYQGEKVLESGNLFLSVLHKINIDLTNIKTLTRTKWAKVEKRRFSRGLIDGGFIPYNEFLDIYDEAEESLWERLRFTPYFRILSEGAPAIFEKSSFLKLEKLCDNTFLEFLGSSKFLTFGVEPVVTYFYAKENEFKVLRMLFTASIYGIEQDVLKERLPEVYGKM